MTSIPEQLISYAVRAPSGHNTQPWQFSVEQDTIRIYPDLSRRLCVVDPEDHALFISLGCALENLVVAAAQQGLVVSIDYFPSDELEECLRVRLLEGAREGEDDAGETRGRSGPTGKGDPQFLPTAALHCPGE
jgi:hypothetical protein